VHEIMELTKGGRLVIASPDCGSRNPEFSSYLDASHLEDETCSAIKHALSRSWFRRLWCLQEVQLGDPRDSLIQLGHLTIKVSHWRRTTIYLHFCASTPSDMRRAVFSAVSTADLTTDWGFLTLLETSLEKECSDSRDHIYGILGLVSPSLASLISPNYATSWTTADVFKDVVLKHLGLVRRLEMLELCGHPEAVPSWIPQPDGVALPPRFPYGMFAAGFSSAECVFEAPGVLQVTGVACAVVSEVGTQLPKMSSHGEAVAIIRSWEPDAINSLPWSSARAGVAGSRRRAHVINLS
jgi:hypothetical protein